MGENVRTWEQSIEDKDNRRYDSAEIRKSEKMYGPGNKRIMEDKENRKYDSLEDRKVRTCMDWEQWRIKRTAGMIVWKIGK
jgi:hypothetical protein